ncbi:MAG TPA: type VI secretion system-associated FHA domain protein TagH [Stellaceae bacterium]|jgi:type VI secretion system FHA domain protein|nr:type VI secretion system-associated FHA domain protein TagH [Stellaceae bacterium]
MKLILSVISSQTGGATPGTSQSIERGQIVIGRGAGCDWILPDPDHHLSKQHCTVAATGAGFTVTDTSTNGVFLNNDDTALGKGRSAAIGDGDHLVLGNYVLEARLSALAAQPQRSAPLDEDDPFGIADIVAKRAPPAPIPARQPPPVEPSPFAARPTDFSAGGPGPIIPEDIDLLNDDDANALPGAPARGTGEWRGAAAIPDHLPAERMAFTAPKVEGAAIPDDWLGDAAVPAAAPVAAPTPRGDAATAFIAGAGLAPGTLAGQDEAAAMRAAGKAYRAAILGLAEILRTRAAIKSEFRIEQTRIGANNNNPLKFLTEAQDIVAAMVGKPPAGFQEAGVALDEGIRDLKAHQLAMVAAMQVALTGLLSQLDPATLKASMEKQSLLGGVLGGSRNARYWEVFEQHYKTIAKQLEEDFHGVFGRAFAQAYEDALLNR